MDRNVEIPKAALVAAVAVPLALLVGFTLANPLSQMAFAVVGAVALVLTLPFSLAHHHLLLLACWNSTLIVYFLPGQPHLAMVLACGSLGIATFSRMVRNSASAVRPFKLTLPLGLLAAVVIVTAVINGGIGGRVLGTERWGLRNYVFIAGALIGYWAITARSIPRERVWLAAVLYVGSSMTAAISDLAYAAGPKFHFLFAFFHTEYAVHQVVSADSVLRLAGVGNAGMAATSLLFLRYGVRGLLEWRHPWRLGALILFLGVSLLGGFRSTIVLFLLTFAVMFFLEGLHRTVLLPLMAAVAAVTLVLLVNFAEALPLSVQRCISFLPIRLHPEVEFNSRHSLEWRLGMWKRAVEEIPQHFWWGKGYSFNATDYLMATEAVRRGEADSYEGFFISGDFHNGILTTLLPLGIFGLVTFVWFGGAALWVLIQNYRWGEAEWALINRFILATFLVRFVYFFTFYGSFVRDLGFFCGFVALSLAINQGVRSAPARPTQPQPGAG